MIFPFLPAHDPGFHFSISYLLWQPTQEQTILAMSNYYADTLMYPTYEQGTTYGPKFPLQSGLQCTIGTRIHHESPVELQFTYRTLFPQLTTNSIAIDDPYTYPLFSVIPGQDIFTSDIALIDHYSVWKNYYQWIDWGVQRTTQFTSHLWLTPQIGFGATWQKQVWWNNEYLFTTHPITSQYLYHFTQTFSGIGPKMGFSADFLLYKNWLKLHFDQNISALYGPVNTQTWLATLQNTVSGQNTNVYLDNQNQHSKLIPVLYFGIGFEGQLTKHFSCKAAWDMESWIAFNHMLATTPLNLSGATLTFQGLTVDFIANF